MIKKISIIGAGKMGSIFYKALATLVGAENLMICDRHAEKMAALSPIHSSSDVNEAIVFADLVILAVKPQSFDELCMQFKAPINNKLILSIMAGITIERLIKKTGSRKIVRSLPNLPMQVRKGVTLYTASHDVTDQEKDFVRNLFSQFGQSIELSAESMMDGLSTISGSGPAYFFYLTELLAEKAKTFGLSEKEARLIAEATFTGSAMLLEKNEKAAQEWREAVCTKGGITEAAIVHLKKQGFDKIFFKALEQAKKRSEELSQ